MILNQKRQITELNLKSRFQIE